MKVVGVFIGLIFAMIAQAQAIPKTQFGVQLRGVVPTKFVDGDNLTLTDGRLSTSLTQMPSASFGFLVRQQLNETFSIETGISYNRRRFGIVVEDPSVALIDQSTLRLVSYEIPVHGLLYVRTGRNSYLNTSAGPVFNFLPSDLEKIGLDYQMNLRTGNWLKMGLAVNLGYEVRFEKKGALYAGLSYNRALQPTAQALFRYVPNEDSLIYRTQGNVEGSFISIDLRYFFNE